MTPAQTAPDQPLLHFGDFIEAFYESSWLLHPHRGKGACQLVLLGTASSTLLPGALDIRGATRKTTLLMSNKSRHSF
jgi:hypothetical protein